MDEAQAMLQSAGPKEQGKLQIDEYANLLFSNEDKLNNIDLKVLKPAETMPESAWSRFAPTEYSDLPEPKNLHEDDYVVLDNKKVP